VRRAVRNSRKPLRNWGTARLGAPAGAPAARAPTAARSLQFARVRPLPTR